MPMFRNLVTLWLLSLGLCLTACSQQGSMLVVQVNGWPQDANRLRVLPSFAGKPGKIFYVDKDTSQFKVVVPTGQAGKVAVEAMVEVKGQDGSPCFEAGGLVAWDFAGGSDAEVQHAKLMLSKYALKQCATVCSPDNWCWENPLPQGNPLGALWGDRSENVWAVGLGGTILRYYDTYWSSMPSGTLKNLYSVWGSGNGDVWAGGENGSIVHWDGYQWTTVISGTGNSITSIWGSGENDIWAAAGNILLHSKGNTWEKVELPYGSQVKAVWGSDANHIWAVGNTILYFNGTSLSPVPALPPTNLSIVWGSSSDDVWAGGGSASLWHYNRGQWSLFPSQLGGVVYSIWGTGANDIWAVGGTADDINSAGTIFHYQNGVWNQDKSITTDRPLTAIWGSGTNDIWAVGSAFSPFSANVGFGIIHSDGISWKTKTAWNLSALFSVWASGPTDVWVGGVSGSTGSPALLHQAGDGWNTVSLPDSTGFLLAIWGSSALDIWAVTSTEGSLLHYQGVGWLPVSTGVSAGLRSISGTAANDIWTVGDSGNFAHYNGSQWMPSQSGTAGLSSVWSTSYNDAWAVGIPSALLHYDSVSWTSKGAAMMANTFGVWAANATTAWAVGSTIYKWDGTSWMPVGSPTAQFLRAIWGSSPNDIWAVGDMGTIIHYDGIGWSSVLSGTTQNLRSVWGKGTSDVWAVGLHGTILHHRSQ